MWAKVKEHDDHMDGVKGMTGFFQLSYSFPILLWRYYTKFCTPLVSTLGHEKHDIRERDAVSKLAMTERHITGVEKNIRDGEERHKRNDRKRQTLILDSVFECTASLETAQQKFGEKLDKELKDIAQKQDYMNKYLSKLL